MNGTATEVATRDRPFVAELLSRTLGNEKAAEVVDDAADMLGYGVALSRPEALDLLEEIASNPGVVGVTARFAKSRLHMLWEPQTARR